MAQLRLGYPELQRRGAEVVQVTHNTPAEAALYFRDAPPAFPYLCDAARTAHEAYGIGMDRPGPLEGLRKLAVSTAASVADLARHGETTPSPIPYLVRYRLKDAPQAVFVVDRGGVVRAVFAAGPDDAIPANAELVRAVAALASA